MSIRRWITKYFGFSRTESNGFLILLPLIAIAIFSEPVYRWWVTQYRYQPPDNTKKLDSLVALWPSPVRRDSTAPLPRNFQFNPNTASAEDLVSLGLPDRVARRILAYRSGGGRFRTRNDLRKIYGLDSNWYTKNSSLIALPDKPNRPKPAWVTTSHKTPVVLPPFDINTADTSQFIRIYGIGSKLSRRIITYRDRLGGFISMEQLNEVYGLDSVVIQELKKKSFISVDFAPRQININRAGKKELGRIPYITFSLANSIAAYRFSHGDFKSIDDLAKLVLLDELTFQKIKPYLTIKD